MKRRLAFAVVLLLAPAAIAQHLPDGGAATAAQEMDRRRPAGWAAGVLACAPERRRDAASPTAETAAVHGTLAGGIPPNGTSTHTDAAGDTRNSGLFTPFDQSATVSGTKVRTVIPKAIAGPIGNTQWAVSAIVDREGDDDAFDQLTGTWDGVTPLAATSPENLDIEGAADIVGISFGEENATHVFFELELRAAPAFTGNDAAFYFVQFFGGDTSLTVETDVYATINQTLIFDGAALPIAPFEDLTGATVTTGGGNLTVTIDTADSIPDVPGVSFGQPYFVVSLEDGNRALFYEFDRASEQWSASLGESVSGQFYSVNVPVTVTSSRSGNSLTLGVPLSELGLSKPLLSFRVSALSIFGPADEQFYVVFDRLPSGSGLAPHTCQGTCTSDVPETAVRNTPVTFSANYTMPDDSPAACTANLTYTWTFGDSTTATGPTVLHTYDSTGSKNWSVVVKGDGGEVCRMSGQISITAPPKVISSFAPMTGSVKGTTTVTIHGENFEPGDRVVFGTSASTSVAVIDDNTIVAIAPAQPIGQVDLHVVSAGGNNHATASSFAYAVAPVTNLVATWHQGTTNLVRWSYPRAEVDYFYIFRKNLNGWTFLGTEGPDSNGEVAFFDANATPWHVYLYKVRPVADDSVGPDSNVDHALSAAFTDSLIAQVTPVSALHFNELRYAVSYLRFLAGLPEVSWTDPALGGKPAKLIHLTQLQTALAQAFAAMGKSFTPSDPAVPGMRIRAKDLMEMRDAME